MDTAILPILLALLIGVAHIWSDRVCIVCTIYGEQVISVVAGAATAYVFMNLYPEFYREAAALNPWIFSSVFFGFVAFHLIDKEIYQKFRRGKVPKEIKEAHGYGLIIYYFVVGVTLAKLLNISFRNGILFFVPVLIYAALSTLSKHGIHGMHGPYYRVISHLHFMQAIAVVVGSAIALIIPIPEHVLIYSIGLVAGILTYVVVRDLLPKGRKGYPLYFIIGAAIYLALIGLLWHI
jgi:hypothetical protein